MVLSMSEGTSPEPLFNAVHSYATQLESTIDQVSAIHREAARKLATWISDRLSRGEAANVIVICTGNSRRSVLGSVMGNVSADFYNLPALHFFSGGTTPSAFNRRTITALQAIGIEISATGNEAPRGDLTTPNPIFQVTWGSGSTLEFSKAYNEASNPQTDFAALLVCIEADGACPFVPGAGARIPCPFTDPKEFDDTTNEADRYADKRDEIGRFVMLVVRDVAAAVNK